MNKESHPMFMMNINTQYSLMLWLSQQFNENTTEYYAMNE